MHAAMHVAMLRFFPLPFPRSNSLCLLGNMLCDIRIISHIYIYIYIQSNIGQSLVIIHFPHMPHVVLLLYNYPQIYCIILLNIILLILIIIILSSYLLSAHCFPCLCYYCQSVRHFSCFVSYFILSDTNIS